MIRPHSIVNLALLSAQMEVLLIPKKFWLKKTRRSIFASKPYLDSVNKLSINTCNKLFDTLFLPIILYGSEIWGPYDNLNIKKWEKDPVERLHRHNSTKYYLGLNKRAPNVVV